MKKKIAIMLTLILAAGTFTACTAEEKVNNDIKASVVSKTADVSVSETTSVISTTSQIETTKTAETTVKPTVSLDLRKRIPNPKKKSTVGKIRRLFRQLNRLKQNRIQYQKIRSRKPKQPKKNMLKKQQRNQPKR